MMNFTQSSKTIAAALVIASFCVFSVHSAQAQSERLKATIPFAFYAGDTLMPAGDYQVEKIVNGVIRLYNTENQAMFQTVQLSNPARRDDSGKIVFNRYGDDYFISEMWWAGTSGFKPLISKRERQLASTHAPDRVSVAHR